MSNAATVTVSGPSFVVLDSPGPGELVFGQSFQLLVSAADMPKNNGATLGLIWNPNVVNITSIALAPGSPFDTLAANTPTFNPFTVAFSAIGTLCDPTGPVGFRTNPCSFPVIVINGTTHGFGFTGIHLVDDHNTKCWGDPDTFDCFATSPTYFYTGTPVPAAAWLFSSALAALGWVRRLTAERLVSETLRVRSDRGRA